VTAQSTIELGIATQFVEMVELVAVVKVVPDIVLGKIWVSMLDLKEDARHSPVRDVCLVRRAKDDHSLGMFAVVDVRV